MRNTTPINTIEDLVKYALIETDNKFQLRDSTDYEYDDPAEGQAWLDNRESVIGKCPGYQGDGYKEWKKRDAAYDETRPKIHPVKTWSLQRGYHTEYSLSRELGEKIDAIWSKKESRYYRDQMNRTGALTFAGILKRLGRTDIAKTIKEAESKRKTQQEIDRRNATRRSLQKQIDALETWVNSYGKEIGVTAEMFQLPVELADCLKEE